VAVKGREVERKKGGEEKGRGEAVISETERRGWGATDDLRESHVLPIISSGRLRGTGGRTKLKKKKEELKIGGLNRVEMEKGLPLLPKA